MELKEKILKILQEETYCDNSMGNFLKEEDFELIAGKIVKLFAIPAVIKSVCDHNWKEWEDENCNAQIRCTKCKAVKQTVL